MDIPGPPPAHCAENNSPPLPSFPELIRSSPHHAMATETTTTNAGGLGEQFQSNRNVSPVYPREPLELKGVLDGYKSFDVTPVIGKEFPDAQLVDWLSAPNSDELIRDLAITSMSLTQTKTNHYHYARLRMSGSQSPNVVSSSFESKMHSPTTCRKYLPRDSASLQESRQLPNCTSTLSSTPGEHLAVMMTRSASSARSRERHFTRTSTMIRARRGSRARLNGIVISLLSLSQATMLSYV